jgi:spore germination protein GerM
VQIFLVASSGRLVSVTREVPAQQESLSRALQVLVKGPTSAETASGLESAVPQQTTVLGAAIGVGGIATVNLAGTFAQLVGQAQIQAVAQILFTAAALPGVGSVTFELEGKPVDVPVASGAQVRVVNPTQFTSLAPLPVLTPGG